MSTLNSGEQEDADTLASDTSNALLNEMDRATGTSFGQPMNHDTPGLVTSAGLDRDFYARTLASDVATPERLQAALKIVKAYEPAPPGSVANPDERQYAEMVGVNPNDDDAVLAAYWKGWQEMAENLVTRALTLIANSDGPVERPNALDLFGLGANKD
ncbi:MAG: hypothetical protein ACRDTJ_12505 [Pseudonocardiaceae bacterium]